MRILSNLIKYTLTFLIIFFLSFMWIEYVKRDFSLSLYLSIPLSLFITIIFYLIERKKEKKKYKSQVEQQKIEQFGKNLLLCDSTTLNTLLSPLKQANATYYTMFDTTKLTIDDVLSCIKEAEHDQIIFFCFDYQKEVLDFTKHIKHKQVKMLNYFDIYEMLNTSHTPIDIPMNWQEAKHTNLKLILSTALKKEKAKSYFYCALLLSLGSLFLRYNIYYIVVSSFLFLLSLYALCNKKYNEKR